MRVREPSTALAATHAIRFSALLRRFLWRIAAINLGCFNLHPAPGDRYDLWLSVATRFAIASPSIARPQASVDQALGDQDDYPDQDEPSLPRSFWFHFHGVRSRQGAGDAISSVGGDASRGEQSREEGVGVLRAKSRSLRGGRRLVASGRILTAVALLLRKDREGKPLSGRHGVRGCDKHKGRPRI